MKKIIFCIYGMTFSLLFNYSHAQVKFNGTPSSQWARFEEIIAKSTLIIEGEVISAKSFEYNGNIYTSSLIKITKLFKGEIADSIIEVINKGGVYGSKGELVDGELDAAKGDDGIFLLRENDIQGTMRTDFKSFRTTHGNAGFIAYHTQHSRVANHYATCCHGVVFDNLETELYSRIETATKVSRKVYGPNILELEAASKLKNK